MSIKNIVNSQLAEISTYDAGGNITGLNVSGDVTANAFIGDGSQLTGLPASYANADVTTLLASGNVTSNIITTGNISGGYVLGNGAFLTGIPPGYTDANVTTLLASGNVSSNIVTTATIVGQDIVSNSTITSSGNVTVGSTLNVQEITGGAMQISATGTLQNISLSATGNIDVGATYINRVLDPAQAQDAATKYYVDASAQGLAVKPPVLLATAAALPAYTYADGGNVSDPGVGATITMSATGNLTIDGVLAASNNRVLVKNETAGNAPYNGIYTVTTAGATGVAAVLTRSTDDDQPADVYGALVFVNSGNSNAGTSWFDTNQISTPVTIGTSDINWVQFSSSSVAAGNGLSQSGQYFNVNTDPNTTWINGSNQVGVKPSANLVTPNIGNAVGNTVTLTGNLTTSATVNAGFAVVAGNITTGNLLTNGYYFANGTPLSFDSTGIVNGTSSVDIPVSNAAVLFTVNNAFAGAIGANVTILGDTSGINGFFVKPVRNDLSNIANVVYYNATTNEITYAPAPQTYGNANVAAYLANAATNGDIYGANIRANGIFATTGNAFVGGALAVTGSANVGSNLLVSGTTTVTGNIAGTSNLTIGGNITGGNLSVGTSGNIIAGNVQAGYYTTQLGTNGNITIDPDGTGVFVISDRTPTYFANSAPSIDPTTGATTFAGGVGILGNLNVGGNFSANNTNFNNIAVSGTGNIGNLVVPGTTTLTGNAATGNINATGAVTAAGNVTGANLNSSGVMTATGNVTGGNVISNGIVSAVGNVSGANFTTSGVVFATGAVTGGTLNTAGTANVGTLAVVGNATVGNNLTVSDNFTAANIATGGTVTANGNITGANLNTAGAVTATGNVTGSNLITAGNANISGNVLANYIRAVNDVTADANVNAAAVNTSNIYGSTVAITATGGNSGINLNTAGAGNIVINSSYINGVLNPVQAQDAATKAYVDSVAVGLQYKQSSNVATTTGLPAYTYNNGVFGVGATITGNVNGLLTIDTVAMTANARVLVKDETSTNAPYNGIYEVTVPGDAGNAYVLTRSSDDDTPAEMYGAYTFIESGAVNGTTSWTCTAVSATPVVIGFDAINWVQFARPSEYQAGNGLSLSGTVFNVNVDNDTTAIVGANVTVKAGANLVTPNIGNAVGNSLTLVGTGNISGGNLAIAGLTTVGANLTAGNVSTGIVTATGNISGNNLTLSGTMTAAGTATAGNLITAGDLRVNGQATIDDSVSVLTNLFVGPTSNTATLTGPVIFAQGAANAFSQIGLQSINGNSSADLIAYANNGSDSDGYADIGMTGNTFNDTNFTITKPNDGYVFVQGTSEGGGNLVLATGDAGNTHDIVLATGGFLETNEKLRLVDATSTLVPYANLAMDLGNSTNYFGNVYAKGLTLDGDFTANNVTAISNISGGNLSVTGVSSLGVNANVGNLTVAGNSTVTGSQIVSGDVIAGNVNAALGNVVGNNIQANTLTVAGVSTLTSVGNLKIYGGANGQAIITDGTGNLSWGNAGSGGGTANILTIPAVYFTSVANANNQTFSNVVLAGYPNAESMTVFFNGALLENSYYTLSVDTITINTPLVVGDTIDIPTQYGGSLTTVSSGYGNSNVAAFFNNYAGDIVPQSSNGYTLGNTTRYWNTVYASNANVANLYATGYVFGTEIFGNTASIAAITANTISGNTITANGNITGGGLTINGNATITGNAQILGTLTYNNITNLTTSNLILSLGNNQSGIAVTGGGMTVGNTAEASLTYNYTTQAWVSNIGLTANGNIAGDNITATGNVSGTYFLGNGALLTGVTTSSNSIFNGSSNVVIGSLSGNITMGVNSASNVVVITDDSLTVAGNIYDINGQVYGVPASFAKYTRLTTQVVGSNTVVVFNVLENQFGSDIGVDTTTGNITLQAGKTYRLRGNPGMLVPTASSNAFIVSSWYNATTNAFIGPDARQYAATATAPFAQSPVYGGTAEYVITPSVTTVVQFRAFANGGTVIGSDGTLTQMPWMDVEVIGGQAAITNTIQYGAATNIVADNTNLSTNAAAPTNLMTINIPSAGTWTITPTISYSTAAQPSTGYYALYAGTTPTPSNIVPNTGVYMVSISSAAGAIGGTSTTTYTVTTTGPATYTIGATASVGVVTIFNSSGGRTRATFTQIAGLASTAALPTLSLAKFTRTTDQTGVVANSVVICNVAEATAGGDIDVNITTGNVTLQPNNTYRLRGQVGYCNLSSGSSAAMTYQWFNVTTSSWVGQGAGIVAVADGSGDAWNQGTAEYVFTPTVATVVQLRVVGPANTNSILVKNGSNYSTSWKIGAPYIDIEVIGQQAPSTGEPNWTSAGTIQSVGLGGTTSAPTLATSATQNNISFKQIGPKTWQVMGTYEQPNSTGAANGSGDYLFTLPRGLQFDTTVPGQASYQLNVSTSSTDILGRAIPGATAFMTNNGDYSVSTWPCGAVVWDATRYRLSIPLSNGFRFWSNGWFQVGAGQALRSFWTFTFQST